jgi:RNase P subunit RPR2
MIKIIEDKNEVSASAEVTCDKCGRKVAKVTTRSRTNMDANLTDVSIFCPCGEEVVVTNL